MGNIIEMNRATLNRAKLNYVDLNATDLGVKTGRKELDVYFPKKRKTVKERLIAFLGK